MFGVPDIDKIKDIHLAFITDKLHKKDIRLCYIH